jgi:hypothetical protein
LLAHLYRPYPSPLLSSLLTSHVAPSRSHMVLIQLGVFDWWLSLQPPAHAGSSAADFSTLRMQTIRSSETSVHTRSTRRHLLLHSEVTLLVSMLHWLESICDQLHVCYEL